LARYSVPPNHHISRARADDRTKRGSHATPGLKEGAEAEKRRFYRGFFTSVAQPSMPSPLLPTPTSSLTFSMPFVPSKNG
jgi:hypothetical protein